MKPTMPLNLDDLGPVRKRFPLPGMPDLYAAIIVGFSCGSPQRAERRAQLARESEVLISATLSVCGEVAEWLKAAVC
jgi:hypothetical protein